MTKNGAPIRDVKILIGISISENPLAAQSAKTIRIPPRMQDKAAVCKLLLCVIILAAWGATKPMKVIRPVTETMAETMTVVATSTIPRIIFTLTPKAEASSLDSPKMVI